MLRPPLFSGWERELSTRTGRNGCGGGVPQEASKFLVHCCINAADECLAIGFGKPVARHHEGDISRPLDGAVFEDKILASWVAHVLERPKGGSNLLEFAGEFAPAGQVIATHDSAQEEGVVCDCGDREQRLDGPVQMYTVCFGARMIELVPVKVCAREDDVSRAFAGSNEELRGTGVHMLVSDEVVPWGDPGDFARREVDNIPAPLPVGWAGPWACSAGGHGGGAHDAAVARAPSSGLGTSLGLRASRA